MEIDYVPPDHASTSAEPTEPKNTDAPKSSGENVTDENAFFDVLDCVEESCDEAEDFYSSDDLSSANANSSDENPDKLSDDFEYEQIYDTNDGNISDCEECLVCEKPTTLDEKGPLPSGWKEVYHESGALLYWQVETNVCSLSRPYFLGTGSTKTHMLPETAIPCMFNDDTTTEAVENAKSGSQEKITDYCKRLFKFKKIKYLKFRSWDVRRSYLLQRDEEGKVVSSKKWIINPRGKSYVAILHEYLQQSLKTQPLYTFSEVDNARTPYAATVTVNGDEYGTGVGMSKKEAKLEAAKATLLVLLPKMKKYILNVGEKSQGKKGNNESEEDEQNVASVFNDIEITDPRVTKLSKRTTEPLPYELLVKCLQKKGDQQEVKFDFKVESAECTMTVGEHTVTVQCDNKRDGKQQAAQALLQALHPYINNWGSLLRLYSNHTTDHYQFGTRQINEEKELEELKNRSPNKTLLTSLRHRMRKLNEAR